MVLRKKRENLNFCALLTAREFRRESELGPRENFTGSESARKTVDWLPPKKSATMTRHAVTSFSMINTTNQLFSRGDDDAPTQSNAHQKA